MPHQASRDTWLPIVRDSVVDRFVTAVGRSMASRSGRSGPGVGTQMLLAIRPEPGKL